MRATSDTREIEATQLAAFLRSLSTTAQLSTKQFLDYEQLAAGGVVLDETIEIVSELGRGGMGRVFLARDHALDRDVAVKFVNPAAVARDPARSLEVLGHEAKATARLNHPNIVSVYRHGSWKGFPYIVFELVQGISLADRLASGPLPLAEALDITRQLLRGLQHSHAAGVLHRDLKPSNIMLRQGLVTILDFGVSSVEWAEPRVRHHPTANSSDPTSRRAGTPAYMAPEQWQGDRQDQRTDLWAAGLLLAEMLTGRSPAADISTASVARDTARPYEVPLCQVAPRHDRQLLGPVAGVVTKATAFRPAQRYADAGEMLDALERATASRPSQRHWLLRAAAVMVMLATAGWVFAARAPVAAALAAPAAPAARSCEWSGSWATMSTSPTGRNLADIELAGREALIGSYGTGMMAGRVERYDGATTVFAGRWTRTDGSDSGGACQYGRFRLQSRHDADEGCIFTGHWSYCDDEPTSADGWWWRGRKLDDR